MLQVQPIVITAPDPRLSQICEPMTEGEDRTWISAMHLALMSHPSGVGLAAPQIGVLKQVIHINPKRRTGIFMINPQIVWRSAEEKTEEEGCLSYPGVVAPVRRHTAIHVSYLDLRWRKYKDPFFGFEARVIQHEMDHLLGRCEIRPAWEAAHKPVAALVESQ